MARLIPRPMAPRLVALSHMTSRRGSAPTASGAPSPTFAPEVRGMYWSARVGSRTWRETGLPADVEVFARRGLGPLSL